MSRIAVLILMCLCLFAADAHAAVPSAGASCADNTDGATACYTNGCYVCTSGTWVAQPLLIGATSTACGSTLLGALQYTASSYVYCDGSAWTGLGATSSTAFSFTNQIGTATNTTISSNAVTLSTLSGTSTATCGTNCTAIARNGSWGGTSVGGFVNGNTIAIRMTSATTNSTAKTTSVTVGTTISGTWTVTTIGTTPDPITFKNQTGLYTSLMITSDEVTLSGFSGSVTANCNSGCTGIALNGVWGGTTLSGFTSGDTIQIKQMSASTANTASTASVTVGSTTSSTWTVTTGADSCPGVTTYGTVCPDGTIFLGYSADEFKKAMTTRCDAGQTWSGSACEGREIGLPWNNGFMDWGGTGYYSDTYGEANTEGLANRADEFSPYYAAKYCYDLDIHGHTDWYLPALNEAQLFLINPALLNFSGDIYWSSTDGFWGNHEMVRVVDVVGGIVSDEYKTSSQRVRCVRTD